MTQAAVRMKRNARVVVTQFQDFAVIEEVPDSVHERRTRPIPIPDMCALVDLSMRPESDL